MMNAKYEMCGGCIFWRAMEESVEGIGKPQYGECLRHPPVIVSALIEHEILHEETFSETMAHDGWTNIKDATRRPITYYCDWCGEYSCSKAGDTIVQLAETAEAHA